MHIEKEIGCNAKDATTEPWKNHIPSHFDQHTVLFRCLLFISGYDVCVCKSVHRTRLAEGYECLLNCVLGTHNAHTKQFRIAINRSCGISSRCI